jgi:hypothetical protein
MFEGPTKKPKVSYAPRLGKTFIELSTMILAEPLQPVTKPFGSTSGLSKPFRPPSFVRSQVGLVQSVPIPATTATVVREPSVDQELLEYSIGETEYRERTFVRPQFATVVREPSVDLELPEHSEEDTEYRERTLMRNPYSACLQYLQSRQ